MIPLVFILISMLDPPTLGFAAIESVNKVLGSDSNNNVEISTGASMAKKNPLSILSGHSSKLYLLGIVIVLSVSMFLIRCLRSLNSKKSLRRLAGGGDCDKTDEGGEKKDDKKKEGGEDEEKKKKDGKKEGDGDGAGAVTGKLVTSTKYELGGVEYDSIEELFEALNIKGAASFVGKGKEKSDQTTGTSETTAQDKAAEGSTKEESEEESEEDSDEGEEITLPEDSDEATEKIKSIILRLQSSVDELKELQNLPKGDGPPKRLLQWQGALVQKKLDQLKSLVPKCGFLAPGILEKFRIDCSSITDSLGRLNLGDLNLDMSQKEIMKKIQDILEEAEEEEEEEEEEDEEGQ